MSGSLICPDFTRLAIADILAILIAFWDFLGFWDDIRRELGQGLKHFRLVIVLNIIVVGQRLISMDDASRFRYWRPYLAFRSDDRPHICFVMVANCRGERYGGGLGPSHDSGSDGFGNISWLSRTHPHNL